MKISLLLCSIFLLLLFSDIKGQLSIGGTPPGFFENSRLKTFLQSEFIQPPDVKKLLAEDAANDAKGKPFRISQMIDVDYNIYQNGHWDTLSSGEIIWRMKIYSPGASGLRLLYDNFYLPVGSKLFLYNENKDFVIGAFTYQNNHVSGQFATEVIPGETCILEYITNPYIKEKPRLTINKIGYIYRGIDMINPKFNSIMSTSFSCEVNVNCSPEGDNWKNVKRSVTRILLDVYLCSGTLLNNTARDFKSYLSTAFHCVDSIENTASKWIFYFNYERSNCSNLSSGVTPRTLIGAYIRAVTPLNSGADGALLELYDKIPSSYNAYWSGWDCSVNPLSGGVCIHHPAGDYKKISTLRSDWYSSTWYSDGAVGSKGQHWSVYFSRTTNGYGIIEGGSSGSGLFGPDELFRGSLSGSNPNLSCSDPGLNSLYGKFSYNWNMHGNDSSRQFKYWLDHTNTGEKRILGMDYNTNKGLNVYWTSSLPVIPIDSLMHFTDETPGDNLSRKWYFEGGIPAISTEKEPYVLYTVPGIYDVKLEIIKDSVTYTKLRTDYSIIKPRPAWIRQNTQFPDPGYGIEGIEIVDSLSVWAWAIDLFDSQQPSITYTRTIDGGLNWKADTINFPGLYGYGISNIYPVSKDSAYTAVFDPSGTRGGKILKTTNGGESWKVQPTALFNAPDGFPNIVYFFTANQGIAIGDPNGGYFEIYTTSDSGNIWTRIESAKIPASLSNEFGITNFYDAINDTIWFGTSAGRVFKSINRGANWNVYNTGISGNVNVKFQNALVGFAFKNSSPFTIKKTIDGGITWVNYSQPQNFLQGGLVHVPGTSNTWVSVAFNDPAGSAFSTNGGVSYMTLDQDVPYTMVKFLNYKVGWAGSFNIDSFTGGIYKWNSSNHVLSSIEEVRKEYPDITSDFLLYPDPANTVIKIQSKKSIVKSCTISIINQQGSIIKTQNINQITTGIPVSIDVADLSSGIYFIRITNEHVHFSGKFLKK